MEKIEKFNTQDDDIVKGDIVVFCDETRRTIERIVGEHRIVFKDGFSCDLFITPIIGIIKVGSRDFKESFVPQQHLEVKQEQKSETAAPTKNSDNFITYQELFKLMESSDTSDLDFSKYFWHYTTLSNLLSIVKAGKFKSRYDAEGSIPHDNKIFNSTTKDVTSKNVSWKTKMHVRFYLRPLNKPFFNFFKNLDSEEQKHCCILCIRKEALYASYKSTFLYFENAVSARDDVYEKSNELNQHRKEKFYVNNLEKFDFAETYSKYDIMQSPRRSLYQEAEFLVWKELSFVFVDKIIFRTKDGLDAFLMKIRDNRNYNSIRNKCCIDWRYFGYKPHD